MIGFLIFGMYSVGYFVISWAACITCSVIVSRNTHFSAGNSSCGSKAHISVIKVWYDFSCLSSIILSIALMRVQRFLILFASSIWKILCKIYFLNWKYNDWCLDHYHRCLQMCKDLVMVYVSLTVCWSNCLWLKGCQ